MVILRLVWNYETNCSSHDEFSLVETVIDDIFLAKQDECQLHFNAVTFTYNGVERSIKVGDNILDHFPGDVIVLF